MRRYTPTPRSDISVVDDGILGADAIGSIEPDAEKRPRLDEYIRDIEGGAYHGEANSLVPCGCIDGRYGCRMRPDSAGGTLTMTVADDLTYQRFGGSKFSMAELVRRTFVHLKQQGYAVGGHTTDYHVGFEMSGCGASDNLSDIYRVMGDKSEVIRRMARRFGIRPSEQDHTMIVARALERSTFSSGLEVLDTMRAVAGEAVIDTLHGGHHEVLVIINKRSGMTLDRDALRGRYGDEYQAFNIDVWSFAPGAHALLSPDVSNEQVQGVVTAMVYYNLATVLTLCGPRMRVAILEE